MKQRDAYRLDHAGAAHQTVTNCLAEHYLFAAGCLTGAQLLARRDRGRTGGRRQSI